MAQQETSSQLPPSYSLDSHADVLGIPEETHPELPAYSSRSDRTRISGRKEFPSVLKNKGKVVAALVLVAAESISKAVPTFIEGSPVRGRVTLCLESPETIQEVTVTVKGSILSIGKDNAEERMPFLNVKTTLWSPAMGNPSGSSTGPNLNSTTGIAFTEKLIGNYEWPFAIDLPREVTVTLPYGSRKEVGTFRLPQTFMERHARATICYEVSTRVCRSRLKTDYRINADFGFIPLIRPEPPGILRRLAYQENTPIPSPDIDPEGWHTLDPISIRGTVFGDRSIEMTCQLSLAIPLSYTRGTVIPMNILLESTDGQALDLLSAPKSIVARLRRIIKYHANSGNTIESFAWKNGIDDSPLAVWWPCTEANAKSDVRRRLNGELHLKKDLKPTSAVMNFRIEYHVVLFPFKAVAFESENTQPLAIIPVEIATVQAIAPPSRIYATPSYDATGTGCVHDTFNPHNALV